MARSFASEKENEMSIVDSKYILENIKYLLLAFRILVISGKHLEV